MNKNPDGTRAYPKVPLKELLPNQPPKNRKVRLESEKISFEESMKIKEQADEYRDLLFGKRNHAPRNLPAILRSIETKRLLRGDAPSKTEISHAGGKLRIRLWKWEQAIIEMRDEIAEIRENQGTPEARWLKKSSEVEADLLDSRIKLDELEAVLRSHTPKVQEGKC